MEDKLKETLEEHFQIKSELDIEKDFSREIKQMNFALKDDKSAQIEKLQRGLTSLQSEPDNLRADVDRLRFERNESLDREEVLNLKIQDFNNRHNGRRENHQGKQYFNTMKTHGHYRR